MKNLVQQCMSLFGVGDIFVDLVNVPRVAFVFKLSVEFFDLGYVVFTSLLTGPHFNDFIILNKLNKFKASLRFFTELAYANF